MNESKRTDVRCENEPQNIQIQVGHRPNNIDKDLPRVITRKTIHRDEGLVQALSLPTISLYNMRSSWAKINNMADDIQMRETDLCFLTEVWERQESKNGFDHDHMY